MVDDEVPWWVYFVVAERLNSVDMTGCIGSRPNAPSNVLLVMGLCCLCQ